MHVVPVSVNDIRPVFLIDVYPNPASTLVYIKGAAGAVCRLMDMPGKILLHQRVVSDNERIDVAALPIGDYVLEIIQDDARKVVKLQKR